MPLAHTYASLLENLSSNYCFSLNLICLKMSMSTAYRYEVENPSAKALKKALERQQQRIRVSIKLVGDVNLCRPRGNKSM